MNRFVFIAKENFTVSKASFEKEKMYKGLDADFYFKIIDDEGNFIFQPKSETRVRFVAKDTGKEVSSKEADQVNLEILEYNSIFKK